MYREILRWGRKRNNADQDILVVLIYLPFSSQIEMKTTTVSKTPDFTIDGSGSASAWGKTEWLSLLRQSSTGASYSTKAKLLYSDNGIYGLFDCEDKKLCNTMQGDFLHLWEEDVVEIFLQPEAARAAYFEYELSPANFELPLIIFNADGKLNSWVPFLYEDHMKTTHATSTRYENDNQVAGWTAEFYIPFALMQPILRDTPVSGTIWKGNLYRIDYDEGESLNSWCATTVNFHEPEKFGWLRFQ